MSLIRRAKALILSPSSEWTNIERENKSTFELYAIYAAPLASIGPIASILATAVIGVRMPFAGSRVRVPMEHALMQGLVSYVLTLAGVFVLALIINALASRFGGTKETSQALKVAIYSSTAAWLASIFVLIPALHVLTILGLYSIYLLYSGLPVLMKSPKEKSTGYTVMVVICAFVVFATAGYVTSTVVPGHSPFGQAGTPAPGEAMAREDSGADRDQMTDEERARVATEAFRQLLKAQQASGE